MIDGDGQNRRPSACATTSPWLSGTLDASDRHRRIDIRLRNAAGAAPAVALV